MVLVPLKHWNNITNNATGMSAHPLLRRHSGKDAAAGSMAEVEVATSARWMCRVKLPPTDFLSSVQICLMIDLLPLLKSLALRLRGKKFHS